MLSMDGMEQAKLQFSKLMADFHSFTMNELALDTSIGQTGDD